MSKTLILDSSAVEHPAVNRRVVGSNPTRGVHGPLVKGLRHRPFTAVTRVRIPHGSSFRRTDYCPFFIFKNKKNHLLTILLKGDFLMVIFQNHFDLSGFAPLDFLGKKNG